MDFLELIDKLVAKGLSTEKSTEVAQQQMDREERQAKEKQERKGK